MKKKKLYVSLLAAGLLCALPAAAQTQVVKLTTAKATGENVTLMVNQTVAGVTVDWGDGTPVQYPKTADALCEIKGQAKGNVITITGNDRFNTLICSDNNLTAIDASGAAKLRSLYCQNNAITTLNVKGCTQLTDLDASNNQLTKITITELTQPLLENINVADNQLLTTTGSGTSFVLRQENVQHVNVAGNKLKTIYTTKNPNLDVLKVSGNDFKGRLALQANTNLTVLMAQSAGITGITSPDGGFTEMHQVVIDNNSIEGGVDFSSSDDMTVLSCANNYINDIKLPARTLSWINCASNMLAFNSLPNASFKPEQMKYAPQGPISIASKLKADENGASYIDMCPSYTDRMNSDYTLDLSDYAYDTNGGKTVSFTLYQVDQDGTKRELTRITGTSTKDNEYFPVKPTTTPGVFSFHKPLSNVVIEMTSTGYPDLVISTTGFAVGKENISSGIADVTTSDDALSIHASAGQLRLSAATTQQVRVFTIDGKQAWNGQVGTSEVSIKLQPGIYVVNGKKVVL